MANDTLILLHPLVRKLFLHLKGSKYKGLENEGWSCQLWVASRIQAKKSQAKGFRPCET